MQDVDDYYHVTTVAILVHVTIVQPACFLSANHGFFTKISSLLSDPIKQLKTIRNLSPLAGNSHGVALTLKLG